ncbi:hypothetical protein DICSQDRAFT_137639 [Dichomitus squalens LYAD-421 SS1]|uniref:Uncharacterized protein n=1 Tax=Dichomitus squalens (strain LYAD-421) TaxID=732165 RepID=R7SX75_DICSQ|nr:uncharacterized protein DICSQDRAFT_137639 [Dichomitus squalens LYAD-421 SS1]EJF60330.1 hypothetical protein DICSQDRAFT_137639 [Dichomitus squalens LYAD-421 SS1]
MADKFPIDVAQIVALFLESMFYGLYLVSFGMCMYTMLLKSRSRHRQRTVFVVVALLLFIFATLDVALLLRHVLDAFVWYHGPGGAIGEFSDISYWVNAMKTVNYVAQTSIADGMLIYRCYIVYGGNWLVPVPLCILWIAGMIVEAFTCYIEFTLHSDAFLNAGQLTPFITSTLSITLVLNLIATSMIVYKIWSIERRSRAIFTMSSVASGTDGLRRAMRIIIESGLMYSVGVIVFFIVYLANNNAQYGVSDCVSSRPPLVLKLSFGCANASCSSRWSRSLYDSFPFLKSRHLMTSYSSGHLVQPDHHPHRPGEVRGEHIPPAYQPNDERRLSILRIPFHQAYWDPFFDHGC